MTIPKFTAEASLSRGGSDYRQNAADVLSAEGVQLAASDVFHPDAYVAALNPQYNCLKRTCIPHVTHGLYYCEWKWLPAHC